MKDFINGLEHKAQETNFSGVIAIHQKEGIQYDVAFGYSDQKNRVPNNTQTKFGTASGTKTFTALGIGRLIEAGYLSLETPMAEINIENSGFIDPKATILNLLTHTSGIYDYYDEEVIEDFDNFFVEIPWYQLETPSNYLPLFQNQQPKFSPGERFSYSNGGYVFLGAIIEAVSQQCYRDFIRQEVLAPAVMDSSGFFALNNLPPNTANGYLEDRQTTNIYNLPIRGGGDGGMFTTAGDIFAFWDSLFNYKILGQPLLTKFLQARQRYNDTLGYGCGIYVRVDGSGYAISGSDAGVGFYSVYIPQGPIVASILSNVSDGDSAMTRYILNHLSDI